jgi:hypothetical protein
LSEKGGTTPLSLRRENQQMPKYVNASEAYKRILRLGFDLSYPTMLKWFKKNGLSEQPTGRYGSIMVDIEKLSGMIPKLKEELTDKLINEETVIQRRGRKPNAPKE